ncbi:hypothetical protein D3C77_404850 [compost metagenome]
MRVWVRRVLDLLKVDQVVGAFGDDIVQPGWRNGIVIALKLHTGVACRCIEPVTQELQSLPSLVEIACGSDRCFFDFFRH